MNPTIESAVIAGTVALTVWAATYVTASLKDRAARRAAAAATARGAVQELIRAALDTKAALAAWEARWRDRRSIRGALAGSIAQLLAGYKEDRLFHGAAHALASAMEWRRASDGAEEAIVTGPMSRVTAAAAQLAMVGDAELRGASAAVTNALGKLATAYAKSPKSATRARADKELDEAVARLGEAARAYNGRPRKG